MPLRRLILLLLSALSGAAALLYQVIWQRELSLIFGGTAQAAAATLAIFFVGLAWGGKVGGVWAERTADPARLYARVEFLLAISALPFLLLMPAYRLLLPTVFGGLVQSPAGMLLSKLLLSAVALLPPSVLMGATWPVLARAFVPGRSTLGSSGALLYASNTFGAAIGAFAAGFLLPPTVGIRATYFVAVGCSCVVAALAWFLPESIRDEASPASNAARAAVESLSRRSVLALGATSGFVVLAAEVLATRLFSQVLHNSVYSYAAIVVAFLGGLSIGAAIAQRLARTRFSPRAVLGVVLLTSSPMLIAAPFLFFRVTGGLDYDLAGSSRVVWALGASLVLPAASLGVVYPYLLRLLQSDEPTFARDLGTLAAANTAGAVVGAIAGGFLMLPTLGLWGSFLALAMLQAATGFLCASSVYARVAAIAAVALATLAGISPPPMVHLSEGDRLLALYEGPSALVSVVEHAGQRQLRANNHYILGGTRSARYERRQANLPLVLHPNLRRVFFLGMGTGITAGASLEHPVESVVVSELLPDAVRASREYFAVETGALHTDPRVRIVAEDGRAYLAATRESFDLIISDLFVPWKAGAGSLYTVDHYRMAIERLNSGGLYAQWLPLYQVTPREFESIAASMAAVFPEVTLWRGEFFDQRPIAMLLGAKQAGALDEATARRRVGELFDAWGDAPTPNQLPFAYYIGRVAPESPLLSGALLNTDDRPVVEYSAPLSHLRVLGGGGEGWFVSDRFVSWCEALRAEPGAIDGPWSRGLSAEARADTDEGMALHRSRVGTGTRAINSEVDTTEPFTDSRW